MNLIFNENLNHILYLIKNAKSYTSNKDLTITKSGDKNYNTTVFNDLEEKLYLKTVQENSEIISFVFKSSKENKHKPIYEFNTSKNYEHYNVCDMNYVVDQLKKLDEKLSQIIKI